MTIPNGATILDAYLQFQVDETNSKPTLLNLAGQDADHALTFESSNGNLTSRPTTTSSVSWSPPLWRTVGEAGPDQQMPDIASVIQEIVGRPGWSSGNSLAIIVTGTGERVAESYNGDQGGSPLLHVECLVNMTPLAVSDRATTAEDTLVTSAVLTNDELGDQPTTITAVTYGTYGTVTFDPFAGTTRYTPNLNFSGTDSYTYTIRDADGETSTATGTVSVSVNAAHATIRVPQDQPTIQAGINAAADGDLVLIAPGTYTEQLTLANKSVILASQFYTTGDPSFIDQTIIDGGGNAVITVDPTAGPDTTIIGLTIQNGEDGIYAFAKLDILNNRFIGHNDAVDYEGGGGLLLNNLFDNNSDDAVDLDGPAEVTIEGNTILNSDDDGIEIRLAGYTGPTLNIIIRDNVIDVSGEDGIQLIDYDIVTNRVIRIERNLIRNSAMVGLGLMDDAESDEDFRAASIPERIYLLNNTFVDNPYAVTGGDNLIALNNLFINSSVIALKEIDGSSIAAHNLFWNNGIDNLGSNLDSNSSTFADPLLDANYQLTGGGPAVDAGVGFFGFNGEVVLDLPDTAYNGVAPDLGAIESDFIGSHARPEVDDQSFQLDENSTDGTVAASDPNVGQTLSHTITLGNTSAAFAVDGSSGEIVVANILALDFKITPSFSLTVQISDDGIPMLSDTATITVDLNDVDEGEPAEPQYAITPPVYSWAMPRLTGLPAVNWTNATSFGGPFPPALVPTTRSQWNSDWPIQASHGRRLRLPLRNWTRASRAASTTP